MRPETTRLAELARVERTAGGEERMSLDLRGIERADSALMAGIVLMARRCREQGTRLRLQGSASVRAWVELCRLDEMVELAGASAN